VTLPPFALAFYDNVLRLDRDGQWWFEALWSEARATALADRLALLNERAARPPEPRPFTTTAWHQTPGRAGHRRAVGACRKRIHAGDLFQANICVRLESRLVGDPLDLFAAGVSELKADRAAFLSGPWGAVASLSPELFLSRHGRQVLSAPIKGTRPLHERSELESSGKDRAENVMIVDLVRNDLGRVSVPGSIAASALAQARAHTGVWHLVSEVSGTLRPEVSDAGLVRAAFPPGSVTGAPKVAALNVIAELESTARGVYTGAIGFASPLAGLELNVAIRTFEVRGDRVWLGVGGGVVADSDPDAEADECMTKARPLLAAIGAELSSEGPCARSSESPCASHGAPRPWRLSPKPVPRPDPKLGVFETVLITDGRPESLARHLARLERSVSALYGAELPPELGAALSEAAAERSGNARMRIDARPSADGAVEIEFVLTPLAARIRPVRLTPMAVPGGLGEHKWIDRRLLDTLAGHCGDEPLLCDLDGFVLETARANVFCVEPGGRLSTPAVDGRILPGVTRARVLELAPELGLIVSVEPIELARLAEADEVFVTGSLGGVEPTHLDRGTDPMRGFVAAGAERLTRGDVTARLARALADADLVTA
jgi:para-aminobenzoate synthetase/4-amino-4-deoxychorismate lyase